MISSEQKSLDAPTPGVPPKYVLVDFSEVHDVIEAMFPLTNSDRDEVINQVFDHYLRLNSMEDFSSFSPRLELLRLDHYTAGTPTHLVAVAHAIHAAVYKALCRLKMDQAVRVQSGFYYAFQGFRPDGRKAVLRNLDH